MKLNPLLINKATRFIEEAGLALTSALQTEGERRRDLLELALIKYVNSLSYLDGLPYIAKLVQKQIRVIEDLLEAEIEKIINTATDSQ